MREIRTFAPAMLVTSESVTKERNFFRMDTIPSNYTSSKLCFKCGEKPRAPGKSRCKDCYSEWKRAYNKRTYDSAKQRDRMLRIKYNMTQKEYDKMFRWQDGVCACCGESETVINKLTGQVQPLSVDHDHESGWVRSLVCSACNRMIGIIENNARGWQAVTYIQRHANRIHTQRYTIKESKE